MAESNALGRAHCFLPRWHFYLSREAPRPANALPTGPFGGPDDLGEERVDLAVHAREVQPLDRLKVEEYARERTSRVKH